MLALTSIRGTCKIDVVIRFSMHLGSLMFCFHFSALVMSRSDAEDGMCMRLRSPSKNSLQAQLRTRPARRNSLD